MLKGQEGIHNVNGEGERGHRARAHMHMQGTPKQPRCGKYKLRPRL